MYERSLGGAVGAEPLKRQEAADRGDVDDRAATLRTHHFQGRTRRHEGGIDVDAKIALEGGELHVRYRGIGDGGGIVDEHIQLLVRGRGGADKFFQALVIGNIQGAGRDAAPELPQRRGQGRERFRAPCAQRQVCSLARETLGNGSTDSLARAGDESDLAA
jgi:hypothetical protein